MRASLVEVTRIATVLSLGGILTVAPAALTGDGLMPSLFSPWGLELRVLASLVTGGVAALVGLGARGWPLYAAAAAAGAVVEQLVWVSGARLQDQLFGAFWISVIALLPATLGYVAAAWWRARLGR